jgi:hypothetical protein
MDVEEDRGTKVDHSPSSASSSSSSSPSSPPKVNLTVRLHCPECNNPNPEVVEGNDSFYHSYIYLFSQTQTKQKHMYTKHTKHEEGSYCIKFDKLRTQL